MIQQPRPDQGLGDPERSAEIQHPAPDLLLPDTLRYQQEKVNDYFDSRSAFWKDVYVSDSLQGAILGYRHAKALAWIDSLALPPDPRVLEIGCGAGLMAVALAQRGFRVQAIDSSETMVELARQQAAKCSVTDRLSVERGDVASLAFADSSFDLVVAIGVIPWIAQPELAIQEMARVLLPGGHLVLTANNRMALRRLLDPAWNPVLFPVKRCVRPALEKVGLRRPAPDGKPAIADLNFYDRRFIDAALADAQLLKIRSMTIGFGPFSVFRRKVLPEPLGILVHYQLQHLADWGAPGIRSTGTHYLVLSRKPALPVT